MKDTQKIELTHDELIRLAHMLSNHRNFLGNTPMENRLEGKLMPYFVAAKANRKERFDQINEALTRGVGL